MSTEPTLALQKAIVSTLRADAATIAIVSTRIWDRVKLDPNPADFPYVRVGEDQDIADLAECIDGSELFLTLHAFSRAVGKPEVKRLAGAVKRALHERDLDIDDNRLVIFEHDQTLFLTDPDGLTEHAVIRFRALTEPL